MSNETNPDYKPSLGEIQGKPYLGAHDAITWFRNDFPAPRSQIITIPDWEHKAIRAEIYVDGVLVSNAHKVGDGSKPLEKLETGAIRRALANLGYGTVAALAAEADGGSNLEAESEARVAMTVAQTDHDKVRATLGGGSSARRVTGEDKPPTVKAPKTKTNGSGLDPMSPMARAQEKQQSAPASEMFQEYDTELLSIERVPAPDWLKKQPGFNQDYQFSCPTGKGRLYCSKLHPFVDAGWVDENDCANIGDIVRFAPQDRPKVRVQINIQGWAELLKVYPHPDLAAPAQPALIPASAPVDGGHYDQG